MPINTGPVYYPFAVVPPTSSSNVFPNDLVIETVFPGVVFDAQEAGATYAVIREVNGCLWFVLNADFNESTLLWTQEDPTNPNTNAYAMEICKSGTWQWLSGAPTLIPGTAVNWLPFYTIDDVGSVISTPQTVTASGDPSQQVIVTWNLGGAAQAVARQVNVTDSSSSGTSLLDNLEVDGVPKWSVDKTGTLVVGFVPASSVINLFVNPTFTGTSTFTGPVVMDSTLLVHGATTMDSSLTVNSTLDVTNNATVNSLNVTTVSTFTGVATFDSNAVFNGLVENGSGGPVVPISSPDGSVTVATVANGYTLEVPSTVIGSARVGYTQNILGPTPSEGFLVPGTAGQVWEVVMSSVVEMGSPLTAGTLTVTGTGGTFGGEWAGGSNNAVNPAATAVPILFGGEAHGGDVVTASWTATGGTIDHVDVIFSAVRIT